MIEIQLPITWTSTKFKDVVTYKKGKKPNILKEESFEGSIPYLDIRALEYGDFRQYADVKSSNFVDNESIAIVWDGARSGWVSKVNGGALGSTIAALTPILIDVDYVYYFLRSKFHFLNTNTRGTGIPHVDPEALWNLTFPLPPLAEQKRIVAKLDEAFKYLDTLKAKLVRIPELLKTFRQALLTQAITGKLTEEWREGKELPFWKLKKLAEVSKRITVGFVGKMSNEYCESGIPFLRSQNVRPFNYSEKGLMYISPEFHSKIKKSTLYPGDVAVVRSGYPGTTCVIPENLKEANCSDILILTPKTELLDPHYVAIFMNSDFGKNIVFHGRVGNAQQHFNTKTLQQTEIELPPIEEQKEIVQEVEALFAKADAIEAYYNTLKEKIDKLPQALLAKAFRGELVSQDLNDEPASMLLERIKAAKEYSGKSNKGQKTKNIKLQLFPIED